MGPGDPDSRWFGPRLRELRIARGLTLADLADRAGVDLDSVHRWEKGTRQPSWASVLAVCKALDVPPQAFMQPPRQQPA